MSTKVSFYILNESSPKERALYTCRIISKAYNNNRKIYIQATNQEEAQNFDTQLWTFNDISFIPHEIYTDGSHAAAPILIGCETAPPEQNDILINLTSEIIPFSQQFSHIIEVVLNDDSAKTLARNRFKIYQQQGYQIETFNV